MTNKAYIRDIRVVWRVPLTPAPKKLDINEALRLEYKSDSGVDLSWWAVNYIVIGDTAYRDDTLMASCGWSLMALNKCFVNALEFFSDLTKHVSQVFPLSSVAVKQLVTASYCLFSIGLALSVLLVSYLLCNTEKFVRKRGFKIFHGNETSNAIEIAIIDLLLYFIPPVPANYPYREELRVIREELM